jgi:hypothetical protein
MPGLAIVERIPNILNFLRSIFNSGYFQSAIFFRYAQKNTPPLVFAKAE